MIARVYLLFFLFIALSNCTPYSYDISRYKKKFEAHRSDFDSLVSLLKAQNLQNGPPINENNLPDEIKRQLAALEISDVSILGRCKDTTVYEFTSNWIKKAALHFSWDLCDKEQSVKGYHGMGGKMIEIWGLGDGWIMWIDYDFI